MPTEETSVQEALENIQPSKISVRGVTKSFRSSRRRLVALDDVSLDLAEGEFVVLVGPSGCGKSTLLNVIAGLERPDTGEVLVDGTAVGNPGRDRMLMFQDAALFPWLDVEGNVLFGLRLKPNLDRKARREVATFYLRMVGLEEFRRAAIHELSGGMKQRVALARSLAPNPRVLLMDEPFGALDAMTREQLYRDLQEIWQARRKTILFVTHNVREAVCLGDRVVLMTPRPGRVREQFPVHLPRPRDISGIDVARLASQITATLGRHLERVADGGES
ncbi:MAG: ABC transporter ATP-binding protein [Planctomycetes bacterium]|nr:ABC transporter ATP-binding protein [Planctomycetota bacterium]